MNMAETLAPSRTAPPQGSSRDTRVKDDGAAGAAQGGDDDSFRDVMSDLSDRAEARRGGTSDQPAGAGRSGAGSQPGSKATQGAASGAADEESAPDTGVAADAAFSSVQSGSLLAQVALALAPVADGAVAPAEGEMAAEAMLTAGGEQDPVKTGWQLLSSLADGGNGEAQAALPDQAGVANALAALGDGIEEATFANLMAPGSQPDDDAASDASFPAIKVTVVGEETHFAPVQSAESALSRLLGAPAPAQSGEPTKAADPASGDGAETPAKNSAPALAVAIDAAQPAGPGGPSSDSQGRGEGSGSEQRAAEGQSTMASADQQGARAGAVMAAEFHAAAASGGATQLADTSPNAQIARRIAAELASPAGRPAATTPGSDSAVKVLHLQLEPANLGSVTVRIALKDNVISLHVEASRHETAFAIEKDREALSNALKSAGYLVDGISSQPASDPARPSLQAQAVSNDGQMSSSLQSQSDSQSGLAQSGGRNQGEERRHFTESGYAPASGVNESRGEGSRASNGALYV